ncbi:SufE family protein [Pasteurella atlantica]|uniref:SufE family protein n=2 Tax=Pasteurellaceae TaxID=712 RepID=A0ACC6HP09_9PAST|nr:SufE family protein [Pasteurella atlantica]MDP8032912.1 SufE family protein [Pasteurella atlantica]MDP8034931.1 SufE family protein [Pasteurella atlantica]MDP8036799.1 SufE family protein [Pasteurella atlantica]MDP8047228.1 SufE family protein [Pasteurella atlantica]MDP8049262.1 SufE family protein [Pasteurella atlantica]
MTLTDIYTQFNHCKIWEERYRLLIKLSRQLPKLTEQELLAIPEIHGCESRLWFSFQVKPREIKAYSDARLMQGLLMIVIVALSEKSHKELQQLNLQHIFDELQITKHLTSTRLNGLQQIEKIVKQQC